MPAEFKDYSIDVGKAIDKITEKWLMEAANEVAAHAQRNCKMHLDGSDVGKALRGSYRADFSEIGEGRATIGSDMEAVYWEEFGTGSHAEEKSKGRKGWWVYVKNGTEHATGGGTTYLTQAEAQDAADYLKRKGLEAYATNGRDPQHTLQNAFIKTEPKAQRLLESLLEGGIGK